MAISTRTNKFPTTEQVIKQCEHAPEAFRFAASQGKQGKYVTWTIQIPFCLLADLFEADSEGSASARSQRAVNNNRARKVTSYISNNSNNYVLPSLTATIEDDKLTAKQEKAAEKRGVILSGYDFITSTTKIDDGDLIGSAVVLSVPVTSRWWFIDGQHRATGIAGLKAALASSGLSIDSVFPNDTISVMCRIDTGLTDRQAHFSSINSTMVKPNGSLNALYSRKCHGASVAISNTVRTQFDSKLVEFEKTSCSGANPRLFAYKTLMDASLSIFNTKMESDMSKADSDYLEDFWKTYLMLDGLHIGFGKTSSEIRLESMLTHSVMVAALGLVGRHFWEQGVTMSSLFKVLNVKMDFSRDASHWVGLCTTEDGKLVKKAANVRATADHIIALLEASSTYKRLTSKKLQAA